MRRRLAGAVLAGLLVAAAAAGDVRLRFIRSAELADAGLRLLLPAGAVADPLPPPAVMDGHFERGGVRQPVRLQNPLEVWRWRQREGRWADERGTRLVLASATLAPPERQVNLAPVDEIEPLLGRSVTGRAWREPDLGLWLSLFWGQPAPLKGTPPARTPFAMAEAWLFRKEAPERGLACAFRLKSGPEAWRVVLLEPAVEVDMASAEKAFVEDLLPSIQYLGKRAVPSSAFPRAPAASGGAAEDAPREASIRRARESIRNMKGWWAAEGPHTIVLSNIRAGRSQLVDAILEDLEILRTAWEAKVPPWEADREVALVRVFGTAEEYVRYVGPEQAWTSGLWVPMRRELVIRPLDEAGVSRNRRAVLGIVYHEAFHQYLDEAFGRIQASPWFNEGHAQYFASAAIGGRRVRFEPDPQARALLETMARAGSLDPAPLFRLDYAGFYARDERLRREHYALAWGLVYFLREGGKKAEPWASLPDRYAAALKATRDPAAATAKALEGVDLKALAEALRQFYR